MEHKLHNYVSEIEKRALLKMFHVFYQAKGK